jgi:hypothetical protein
MGEIMSVTDELLTNNASYTTSFTGPLPLPPAKHVAVVACMDARLNVYAILGLNEGEAHVIRNAGGVITDDEIRSLAIPSTCRASAISPCGKPSRSCASPPGCATYWGGAYHERHRHCRRLRAGHRRGGSRLSPAPAL